MVISLVSESMIRNLVTLEMVDSRSLLRRREAGNDRHRKRLVGSNALIRGDMVWLWLRSALRFVVSHVFAAHFETRQNVAFALYNKKYYRNVPHGNSFTARKTLVCLETY